MIDNHFTLQYNPEDSSEHHTRRRENLKSHNQEHVKSIVTHEQETPLTQSNISEIAI
jgi:hypothetical protein